MEAALYLRNRHVEMGGCDPVAPGPGEARIEVAYCGICGTDLHAYLGHMDQRVANPQILGHEMSGVIAEVGEGVGEWRVGDRVVVRPLQPCGACPACAAGHGHICHKLKFLGLDTPGAMQSSWTVPAHTLHRLPDGVPMSLGALVEPVAVACHDVRLGGVRPGEYVVVIGGGPIGMLIAFVARIAGARVLVSEPNINRRGLAAECGFDAFDPLSGNLPQFVSDATNGAGADVVFEVSGSAAGAAMMTQLPRARGRIVVVGIFAERPTVDLFRFFWRELRLCGARVYEPEDFEQAIRLIAEDRLPLECLITDRRPLADLGVVLAGLAAGEAGMKTLIEINGG